MAITNWLLRRAIRHWQLFLNLCLDIVLATALLASAPLLVNTVLEIGLRHEILAASAPDRNLHLQTYALREASTIAELDRQVRDQLDKRLGEYLDRTILSVNSSWMLPWLDGEPLVNDRVNLSFHEGIIDYVELVAGTWPVESGVFTNTVPVVVGESMARIHQLAEPQQMPCSPCRANPPGWASGCGAPRIRIELNPAMPAAPT